jgi:hypothetical protein
MLFLICDGREEFGGILHSSLRTPMAVDLRRDKRVSGGTEGRQNLDLHYHWSAALPLVLGIVSTLVGDLTIEQWQMVFKI